MASQSASASNASVSVTTAGSPEPEVYTTSRRLITNKDISAGCALSGDKNAIHYGKDRCVTPGTLLVHLASGLVEQTRLLDGIPMLREILRWKFQKPVMTGDSIYLTFKVVNRIPASVEANIEIVTIRLKMLNQHDQTVCVGKWELSVRKHVPST